MSFHPARFATEKQLHRLPAVRDFPRWCGDPMQAANETRTLTQPEMAAALRALLPGIWLRPLREYGRRWRARVGIWTGLDADMPDGLPAVCTTAGLEDGYDGFVHQRLRSWLRERGWCCELQDSDTFFLMPINSAEA